jgi:hypothetical protein
VEEANVAEKEADDEDVEEAFDQTGPSENKKPKLS